MTSRPLSFFSTWFQPLVLTAAFAAWLTARHNGAEIFLPMTISVLLCLIVLEHRMPRNPDMKAALVDRKQDLFYWGFLLGTLVLLEDSLQHGSLEQAFISLRRLIELNIWPTTWPLGAKLVLAWLVSEFFAYWSHRILHRWEVLWRLSGHVTHHSFTKLNVTKGFSVHPIEHFVLIVPGTIVSGLLGAGEAELTGAAALQGIQVALVHANLPLATTPFNWIFTSNRQHMRHHAHEIALSNSNYGCTLILWDRIFGTYAEEPVEYATGVAPGRPLTLARQLMLPFHGWSKAPRQAEPTVRDKN